MNAVKEVLDSILLLLAFVALIAAHSRIDILVRRLDRLERTADHEKGLA